MKPINTTSLHSPAELAPGCRGQPACAGRILGLLAALLCPSVVGLRAAADDTVHRYLYAASPDGAQPKTASGQGILIFDLDNGFKFVRRVAADNAALSGGVRGLAGCLATHSLYYSTTSRHVGRFDLETGKLVWDRTYTSGADRSSVTLDGSKVFVPTGWWEATPDGGFVVVDGATGEELRRIKVGPKAHNSIISPDGRRLYLGTVTTLTVIDPKDERVLMQIPDVGEFDVFPFTIDSKQRYAYVCLGKHVGFDVVDLQQGKVIHRVLAGDAPIPNRTHGVALTPDEKELWISDQKGQKLFIFDATKMPATPKGQVELSMGGHGWVNFSLDGKYAWCHTPEVFDARTKQKVATLLDENGKPVGTSKYIEVHLRSGKVVRMGNEFGIGRTR